jgi:hypothetical protein
MSASDQQIKPIENDRIIEIAELAKIPGDAFSSFAEGFQVLVVRASVFYPFDRDWPSFERQLKVKLRKVEKAAKKLVELISQLDHAALQELGLYIARQEKWGETSDEIETRMQITDLLEDGNFDGRHYVDNVVGKVEQMRMAARTDQWPTSAKGGRRSTMDHLYNPNFGELFRFVFFLEQHIVMHGGRTSFNKNDGTGSLSEILKRLSPYFPQGFLLPWLENPEKYDVLEKASRIDEVKRVADSQTPSGVWKALRLVKVSLDENCHKNF